ncbi:hypothetical protein A0J61_05052, partial [Choanephora cucurbitarum]
ITRSSYSNLNIKTRPEYLGNFQLSADKSGYLKQHEQTNIPCLLLVFIIWSSFQQHQCNSLVVKPSFRDDL